MDPFERELAVNNQTDYYQHQQPDEATQYNANPFEKFSHRLMSPANDKHLSLL
jgi:hypothetical protein